MLNMIIKFGVDLDKKRSQHLPRDFTRFHFTSKRKRMSTIIQNCGSTEHGYDKRIHMKGAAEIILACCSFYLNQDGEKIQLHDEMKSNLLQIIT
jgi:magnesium-transporting ATPase (P-type)